MIDLVLSPEFLIKKISVISYIISAVVLVLFSDVVLRYLVIPTSEFLKEKTRKIHKKRPVLMKFCSEVIATIVFILYCYLGSIFLATYIVAPILREMSFIISIILLLLFFLLMHVLNTERLRRKFLNI